MDAPLYITYIYIFIYGYTRNPPVSFLMPFWTRHCFGVKWRGKLPSSTFPIFRV